MADLRTDYKDDVLDTEVNELRKYQMIQNEDGTVSFVDVTDYLQTGDDFGSADINETNAEIEGIKDEIAEIETELDTKVTNSFTPDRVLYSNSSGKVATAGEITSTELGYLNGVTSNIQTQLDNHDTSLKDLLNRFGKVCTQITDWNEVTDTGFYMASDAANAPASGWFMGLVIKHNSNYVIQELWQFTGGTATVLCAKYIRQKMTNWREWNNIPLAYLEGVTSNIQTQLDSKLSKSGGTMAGKLTTQQVENSTGYSVGANSNAYSTAPFVASAPYNTNTSTRAGYGFHNHGNNGTFLFLAPNGNLSHIGNTGGIKKIMDSTHFSVSGTTLNITTT